MYGVGKQVILRLTQSSRAGTKTELGNIIHSMEVNITLLILNIDKLSLVF